MTLQHSTPGRTPDEMRIRALIDDHASAVQAKDVEAALAPFAVDPVLFDLAPPLQTGGDVATARRDLAAWFATWQGPIGYQTRDFEVVVGGDVAFCHGFVRLHGTKTDGAKNDVWARQTVCLRKQGAEWRIVHQHTSVPFYMDGSFRAAVDLAP